MGLGYIWGASRESELHRSKAHFSSIGRCRSSVGLVTQHHRSYGTHDSPAPAVPCGRDLSPGEVSSSVETSSEKRSYSSHRVLGAAGVILVFGLGVRAVVPGYTTEARREGAALYTSATGTRPKVSPQTQSSCHTFPVEPHLIVTINLTDCDRSFHAILINLGEDIVPLSAFHCAYSGATQVPSTCSFHFEICSSLRGSRDYIRSAYTSPMPTPFPILSLQVNPTRPSMKSRPS